MTKLAFVDTETTGLDPDLHEIWEVGLITRDTDAPMEEDVERRWLLPVDLGRADPYALKVGRYYDRYTDAAWMEAGSDLRSFSGEFAGLTAGAHLVGAVISFDEERLRKLLRAHGACPVAALAPDTEPVIQTVTDANTGYRYHVHDGMTYRPDYGGRCLGCGSLAPDTEEGGT